MNEESIISAVKGHFAESADANLIAAYLFGSVARREARASSDVDIAVLYAKPPQPTLAGLPLNLEAEIERLVKRRVQIIVLNNASADLVHRVLRDGELVYESDRDARIRFEVRMRQTYLDLAPIRRQYRRMARGLHDRS
jgi:uncharacterized protein